MSGDNLAYTITATVIGAVLLGMAVWPSLFPRIQSVPAQVRVEEEGKS